MNNEIQDYERLKSRLRELNKLVRIKPVFLNGCDSKYVSFGGPWGQSYETKGVKSSQVRIYKDYKGDRNLAISYNIGNFGAFEIIVSSQKKQLSPSRANGCNYKDEDYKLSLDHIDGIKYDYVGFSASLNKLLTELREDEDKRNLDYLISFFNMSEVLI